MPPYERNATLDHLDPSREYFLQVVAVSFLGTMNASRPVLFVSPANDSANNPNLYYGRYPSYGQARKIPKFKQRFGVHNTVNSYAASYDSHLDPNLELPFIKLDEAIIVTVVLCVWFSIIVLFCNKWGKIRHLEPYQPDYHKRESTDTEVIVDPFSSFSATHYNPTSKLPSRMNTLNTTNNNNSVSMSNFASIETNAGVNFMTSTTNDISGARKASLSLNEIPGTDHHRRTYSHGSGSGLRFNYQSFSPRLYHCQSTGVYHHHRRPQDPSAAVGSTAPSHHHPHHPAFRHPHATHTTPCSINYSMTSSHGRPSFSLSSSGYSPTRRRSSVQHNPLSNFYASGPPYPGMSQRHTDPTLEEQGAVGGLGFESNKSTPLPELGSQVRHHSLLPLPPNFKLSPDRKIKSAEDLKSLVLELTWASKRYREQDQEQLIAESYH